MRINFSCIIEDIIYKAKNILYLSKLLIVKIEFFVAILKLISKLFL